MIQRTRFYIFDCFGQILEKGDLQVAGKEREAQLSLQFRDIATIVMENTINPDTKRPYSITMIERLMHDIHFAVDPYNSSKKQVQHCFIYCIAMHNSSDLSYFGTFDQLYL